MNGQWRELADGVFARRYRELDLTVGLVLGDERALVVDTRGDEGQGAELAAAIRSVTSLPPAIVLTHAHFDHCFGTRALLAPDGSTPVYAQRGCAAALRATAEPQRAQWSAHYRERGDAATAAALARARVVRPDRLVERSAEVDLGGRTVRLRHPGPGHTDHDLAVFVPDARVLFAGDLVEQGAPPDLGDAVPAGWPRALDELLALDPAVVVPGHGDPVPADFVRTQRVELAAVARLAAAVVAGTLSRQDAVDRSPYPVATTDQAIAQTTLAPASG